MENLASVLAGPRFLQSLALAALLSFPAVGQSDSGARRLDLTPIPEWVQPADLDIEAIAAKATDIYGVAQILQETQTNFLGEKDETFQHMIFGLRTRTAVEAFSVLRAPWHPKTQTVEFHMLRVRRDGEIIDLAPAALVQIGGQRLELPDAQDSDSREMAIIMPDLRIGDILEFAMTTRGATPGLGGTRATVTAAASMLPTARIRIRVLDSPETPVALHVRGGDIEVTSSERQGVRERRIELDDIPALTPEAGAPAWYDQVPSVATTAYASWDGVLEWAMPLFTRSGEVAPEVAAFARQLTSDLDEERAKFSAIAAFVQDHIRYLGPGISRNGYVPFEPSDVLGRRWGDCKDKVTLALAMLDSVGIRAWPALTNIGDGYIDPELPSPSAFDHIILIAEVAGERLWLDATGRALGEGRPSLEPPAANLVLPILAGTAELLAPPPGSTGDEGFHIDMLAEFDLRTGTDLRFSVAYAGTSADAVRLMIEQSTPRVIGDYYLSEFRKSGKDVALEGDTRVEEDEEANLLRVSQDFRAKCLWLKEKSSKFYTFKSVPGRMVQFVPGAPKAGSDRKAPLALAWPLAVRERHVLKLPGNMSLDEFSSVIDRDAYHLSYSWERQDDILTLTTVYRTFRDHLLPEELEDWRADREAMLDWSYAVWTVYGRDEDPEPVEVAAEPGKPSR